MTSQIKIKGVLEVDTDEPFVAQVVRVLRVTPGDTYESVTGLRPQKEKDSVYDVILSDGHHSRKFVLAPAVSPLVRSNRIREGCLVRVTECIERFDERLKSGKEQFIIIKALEPLDNGKPHPLFLRRSAKDKKLTPANPDVSDWEPLGSGRAVYEDLHENTAHPDDPHMRPNRDKYILTPGKWAELKGSVVALSSLEAEDSSSMGKTVVVRIMKRTHVQCFAVASRWQPFPFNSYYLVEDSSARAVCVAWNVCSLEYHNSFQVGDIVVIEGFRMRDLTEYCRGFAMGEGCKLELSVNSANPVGNFWLVHPESDIPAEYCIPPLSGTFNFVQRADFSRVPPGREIDIAGVITHVGRLEHLDEFLHRTLVLVDPSSPRPIFLSLCDRGQHKESESLQVGMLFVGRRCALANELPLQSSHSKHLYVLKASAGTEYTAWLQTPEVDPETRPYSGVPEVDQVADWIAANGPRASVVAGTVGGYLSVYLASGSPFPEFESVAPLSMVATAAKEADHLTTKTLVVPGSITSLVYTDGQGDTAFTNLDDALMTATEEGSEVERGVREEEGEEGKDGPAASSQDQAASSDAAPPRQKRAKSSQSSQASSASASGASASATKKGKAPQQSTAGGDGGSLWRLGEGVLLANNPMPEHLGTHTDAFLPKLVSPPAGNVRPGFWKATVLGLNKDVSLDLILGQANSTFSESSPLDSLVKILPLVDLGVYSADLANPHRTQREKVLLILRALKKQRLIMRVRITSFGGEVEIVAEKIQKRDA